MPSDPVQMTQEEYDALYGESTSSAPIQMTEDEFNATYGESSAPGWLEGLGTSMAKGIGNIAEGVAGGVKWTEDNLGTGTSLGQYMLDMEREYQAPREELLSRVERGSPQFYANAVTEGLTTSVPMLLSPTAAGAAVRGGAMALGQQYDRAIRSGATQDDANKSALLMSGVNAFTSIPVFQAAQATGPLMSRLATSGAVGVGTSIPMTLSQAYADSMATQGEVRPYDLLQPLAENAITGGITGVVAPLGVAGAKRLQGINKAADPAAIGQELEARFLNRPLPDNAMPDAVQPEAPNQTLISDQVVEAPAQPEAPVTQPEAPAPQVEVVQPQEAQPQSEFDVLKNQIDQLKEGLRKIAPDAVDPEPAPLPQPDPVVETTAIIKAPSPESESFPTPMKDVDTAPTVTVESNGANPKDGPSVEQIFESPHSSYAKLAKQAKDLGVDRLDAAQSFFEGQVFGTDVPVVSKMLAAIRNNSMPRTISRKFNEVSDLYFKGGRAEVENEALVRNEMTELLRPYFKAENPQVVDGIIGQTREITKRFQRERAEAVGKLKQTIKKANDIMSGRVKLSGDVEGVKQYAQDLAAEANKQLDEISKRSIPRLTEADMKAVGATDADIQAVLAHKDSMNYALERLREVLKLKGRKINGAEDKKQYDADVDEYINSMIDTNYFPASRTGGKWKVDIRDKDGNALFSTNVASRRQAEKLKAQKLGEFKNVVGVTGKTTEIAQLDVDGLSDLPPNLAEQITQFNPEKYSEIADGRPIRGWTKHLIEAQAVPGYDTDIRTSTIDYTLGFSRYYGRQQAKAIMDDVISNLPEGSKIRGFAERYANDQMVRPEKPVVKAMLKFQNFMKLAAVPASAIVEGTQMMTTTFPKLEGELVKAYGYTGAAAQTPRVMARITRDGFSYLADRVGGKFVGGATRKKNPELFAFLDKAEKTGILESEGLRELYNLRQKVQGGVTAADSLMFMRSAAEQTNRTVALLAGREAGMAQGLKGEALYDFAKEFVITTQFDQTVANRPRVMSHGVGRVMTQYRPFQLNYLRFLRDNAGEPAVVGLSLAAMTGLGGALALPFAADMERIAESMGISPSRSLAKFLKDEKWSDTILYGLPTQTGISISGMVSPGEFMVSDLGGQGLLKLMGPTADYIGNQLPKAYKALKEQDNPIAAFEIAGPRFTRGPLKALRAVDQSRDGQGGLQNYAGRELIDNVQPDEAAALSMGLTPLRLQKENKTIAQEFKILEAAKSKPKDYNGLIAQALKNQDMPRLQSLANEIAEYNAQFADLPPEEQLLRMFVPSSKEIRERIKSGNNPQLDVLRSAPKKARPALVELYKERGKIPGLRQNAIEE